MAINIRAKGQNGEREVAAILEEIIRDALKHHKIEPPNIQIVQRNQNQSAVGGGDLTNTCGLCVEVKRHENLAINTWWKQCVASAERNDEIPCLFYRQNRQPWRVRILVETGTKEFDTFSINLPVTMELEDFKKWFKAYAYYWIFYSNDLKSFKL